MCPTGLDIVLIHCTFCLQRHLCIAEQVHKRFPAAAYAIYIVKDKI